MQSPHDSSRGHSYQRHPNSSPSTHPPNYVDHSGQQAAGYPVMHNPQLQRSPPYGYPQEHLHHQALAAGNPVPNLPIAQPSGPSINSQFIPQQQYSSDAHHHHPPGVVLNPGVPAHYQNYRPIEHGQPVVPSQPHPHFATQQKPYPSPAMQTQGGHAQYSNPANHPSSPIGYGSPSPPSSSSSPHACGVCGATFTRPHDRKRHYESQHTTIEHVCQYCRKSYARVDSLKRHLDRPCDKMPQSAQHGGA